MLNEAWLIFAAFFLLIVEGILVPLCFNNTGSSEIKYRARALRDLSGSEKMSPAPRKYQEDKKNGVVTGDLWPKGYQSKELRNLLLPVPLKAFNHTMLGFVL